ncbi:MAG TPA: GNAT family protein [Thermoanaerobaculia bacterium]|nr:GNAT family protein [Thermoanaerobaculia bacterium]
MIVEPVRLEGRFIHLEPLTLEHAPALFRHAEPEIFRWNAEFPRDDSYEAFHDWLRRTAIEAPASQGYAIRLAETGEPVGVTGYLEIRPQHLSLEIGRTWIGKAWQGTRVNPESKYLLMRHAFEDLRVNRVQFKTDLNNAQSQRAIEKLGAVREGVLRRYQIRSNGLPRDTVMYSVIAEEWPEVRARLEARLEARPPGG